MTRLLERERWIAHLPDADEEAADDLVLVGQLLSAPTEWIRIVSGDLCLTFSTADILSVERSDAPRDEALEGAWPARLIVQRGAALWDVCPRECVAGLLPSGRQPFALSARSTSTPAIPRVRFPRLEEEFLVRNGLRRRNPS
jgi:hypothetical protein